VIGARRALAVALAAAAASCAPPSMKLPSGPGAPAALADTLPAWRDATGGCAGIRTLTAEVAVTGTTGGQRVRVHLLAGVAAPSSVRLEATAPFGAPVFIFVASAGEATLLLPRDNRVLEHGRPEAVLDAVAGLPLGVGDLDRALSGCAGADGEPRDAVRFGDGWLRVTTAAGATAYLNRVGTSWRLSAAAMGPWRIEYPDRRDGVPAAMRLVSLEPQGADPGRRFDLRLALSQIETNVPLEAAAFRVDVPPAAVPITLDDLRHARPGVRED
jgi:hypothetical protein